ncbi:MAG: AAA family ATPase, partial [Polyangiales bacterium]
MKLRSLEVSDFRRIRRAKLELGPGLNVVYGPNDLGKSTLVEALRAALLLPSTSTVANDYVPWDRDATPAVALELEHRGVLYCVKKSWGPGTRASALLERADDGHTFAVDAKSREVDGKLRDLFAWGIASPGGKQAPRGLPESFLTSVLFGTQAESDALFGASLDKDTDEAGRLRLTDALEAYAQDPVLKEILERAQKKVDEAFSATGQKRKGKASPFREPGESVKEAQRELQRAEERLEEAERARGEAERLREALAHATERRDEAREALAEAERDAEATERKQAAERALADARRALADYETDASRAGALADEVKALDERVAARRTALEAALKAEREARDAHDAAKATLRDVRGADAEREMRLWELQRAWDEAVAAANHAKTARAKATEAAEASAKARQSAAKVEAAAAALAEAERAVEDARLTADALEVVRARHERDERVRRVAALADDAAGLEALSASIAEREARLATPLEDAPTTESLDALRRLASERAVAEAKLAVGLSLALRKLGDASVEASADGMSVEAGGRTLALDAARELRVKIGHEGKPLVELVVTGGAADAREEAEAVAKRWRTEASALGLDPDAPPDEALATLAAGVEAGVARRREREDSERA